MKRAELRYDLNLHALRVTLQRLENTFSKPADNLKNRDHIEKNINTEG